MKFWDQFTTDLSRGNSNSFLWGMGVAFFFSGCGVNFLNPSWGKWAGSPGMPGNFLAVAGLSAFLTIILYKLIISLRK